MVFGIAYLDNYLRGRYLDAENKNGDDETKIKSNDDETSDFPQSPTAPLKVDASTMTDREPSKKTRPPLLPWPGSTYIIRLISSGKVLSLLNGQVMLTARDGMGSYRWICEKRHGWLGFRNFASGRYLGCNDRDMLCCIAESHRDREQFCVTMRQNGGCALLIKQNNWLHEVDITVKNGVEKLALVNAAEQIAWEFILV